MGDITKAQVNYILEAWKSRDSGMVAGVPYNAAAPAPANADLAHYFEALREKLEAAEAECVSLRMERDDALRSQFKVKTSKQAAQIILELEARVRELESPDGTRVVAIGGEMLTGSEIYARSLEEVKIRHELKTRAEAAEKALGEARGMIDQYASWCGAASEHEWARQANAWLSAHAEAAEKNLDKATQVIEKLEKACNSLMDDDDGEVTGKRATDWGLVNDALLDAQSWRKNEIK